MADIDRIFYAYDALVARASIMSLGPKELYSGGALTASASISGSWAKGIRILGELVALGTMHGELLVHQRRTNWVAWSKIGSVDFTLDRTNDAGGRPVSWSGWVHQLKMLDKNVVVYGSNGIAILMPVTEPAPTFGYKDIHPNGLLDRNLLVGTDMIHYFVDTDGNLCSLDSQGIKVLGYRSYLKTLHQMGRIPTMHLERQSQRIFICNGVVGFIYTKNGLGWGPANITGLIQRDGEVKLVSPQEFTYAPALVETQILDVGTRDMKPLQKITISTYSPEDFYFQIDHRADIKQQFRTTAWKRFNSRGEGFVGISAIEFRVRVKSLTPVETQIDDLVMHFRSPYTTKEREVVK